MKLPVNDRIRAALEDIENRITIGFEVETDCNGENEFDEDSAREAAYDSIDVESVCSYLGLDYDTAWLRAIGAYRDYERLLEVTSTDESDVIDSIVENYRDNGDFYTESSSWEDLGSQVNGLARYSWDYDEDGSVNGPEFKSPICKGAEMAMEYANDLFEAISKVDELEIHSCCSCHIHVRLNDVYHTGCNALQQLLFSEVMKRIGDLPSSVRDRIRECPKWIAPTEKGTETCKHKYNPIQCHSGYGTWEFRLFGNVSDADDFGTCLEVALHAMKQAYTKYLDRTYTELPASEWVSLATIAMQQLKPIETVIAQQLQAV